MSNKNVYIVLCNKSVVNVFDSKEKAFYSIPQPDEFTEVAQSIRTYDGEEQIIPTEDTVYLDVPIYVHVIEHTEDLIGMSVEYPESTEIYRIREFKVK